MLHPLHSHSWAWSTNGDIYCYSFRIRDPVHLSGYCNDRRCAGFGRLCTFVRPATVCVCGSGTDHPTQVSGRLCAYGVDETAIRGDYRLVLVCFDVSLTAEYESPQLALLTTHSLITIWLYLVAELSALQQVVSLLTGLDGLPAVIVECFVTTVYTALGGFKVSVVTDNIQGAMVVGLVIIATITVGTRTGIDRSLIPVSGYLEPSLLGWQLIYILPVAILTNDFFLSGFWMRTFAAKTDKDLWIGVSIAVFAIVIILTLVGFGGILAGWSGVLGNPPVPTGIELFSLFETLPGWVVGIVLVMVVSLSTAAFDSLQSALISTGSNDLFRNKLNIWVIRALVVVVFVPTVVIALKSPSVLQIYLISDLISASTIPVLVVGLSSKCYWWRGFEVVVGGLGGIFTIFGAFVAAPVGGLLWAAVAFCLRISIQWTLARTRGKRFDAFDRPAVSDAGFSTEAGRFSVMRRDSEQVANIDEGGVQNKSNGGATSRPVRVKGKFF